MVTTDSLPTNKDFNVRKAIGTVEASVGTLLSYSASLNPIENAFSKLKTIPSRLTAITIAGFSDIIRDAPPHFIQGDCTSYSTDAGHKPE